MLAEVVYYESVLLFLKVAREIFDIKHKIIANWYYTDEFVFSVCYF